MNKIFLIGRISNNLELRSTKNGNNVCEFNLAVNRIKDGVDFITVQTWGKIAENIVQYQQKGNQIAIFGELRSEHFKDKKGDNRIKAYVLASDVEFITKKKEEQKQEKDPFKEFGNSIKTESQIGEQIKIEDNDLPF